MNVKTVGKPLKGARTKLTHLKMKIGEQATTYEKIEKQDELADKYGLAIVLADENSSALSKSNNNSMCEMLYNSAEFAPECDKFCGKAFEWATETGKTVGYKCHAGLNCLAVPLKKEEKQIVAIVGRAFTKAEDYRNATERAIEGDWRQFPADEFFENVLLANSNENLEKLARRVEKQEGEEKRNGEEKEVLNSEIQIPLSEIYTTNNGQRVAGDRQNQKSEIPNFKSKHWRSLFGSLLDLSYRQACFLTLQFIADRYSLEHLAWLERRKDDNLETIYAKGNLKERDIQIGMSAEDKRLLDALKNETSLELRERQTDKTDKNPQTIRLFPISVGEEVRSAIVIGDEIAEKEKQIAKFCRNIATDLEILRLREQLARRGWLERAVWKFNESLESIDSEDFWTHLTNISAELLKAERSSLLVFDEKSDVFVAKAATGIKSDFIKKLNINLGERVSRNVLNGGEAIVVEDINKIGLQAAPKDWLYKSDSFISYPIAIGARKIGVLNFTDRADGEIYSDLDLELLHAIVPQLAVLIDRAGLKDKAGEFEQLSVTDALTGLLNRRYLEERLTEEIKRSNRHGFPMSFMMIDVDEFKSYNDNFGHAEGDKALQIVGASLKETLRGADVAVRYGGEEFSILLPQTSSEEAIVIAERLRERVEKTEFPHRKVTISVGIASCSLSLNSPRDLIAAADKALYVAKRRGRNNVQVYEDLKK
jgi:diguanylate cyclase (GGDEF)-like protein